MLTPSHLIRTKLVTFTSSVGQPKFLILFFPLTALSQILRGMVWCKIIHSLKINLTVEAFQDFQPVQVLFLPKDQMFKMSQCSVAKKIHIILEKQVGLKWKLPKNVFYKKCFLQKI